jgi:hypothetical protein
MVFTDDAEGDDDGFIGYVETTNDPGAVMLVATVLTCIALVAILPLLVYFGKRCHKKEEEGADRAGTSDENTAAAADSPQVSKGPSDGGQKDEEGEDESVNSADTGMSDSVHSVASAVMGAILDASPRTGPAPRRRKRYHEAQYMASESLGVKGEWADMDGGSVATSSVGEGSLSMNQDQLSNMSVKAPSSIKGKDPLAQPEDDVEEWKPSCIERSWNKMLIIAEWDYEMKRICRLGTPFVIEALLEGITEAARVAIIGKLIGTKELSAYVVVDLLVGLTTQFFGGFQDALTTLCSQAVGVGNRKLAGQYVQISAFIYTTCFIPVFIFWYFFVDDTIRWLGFDDEVAQMGRDFALLFMFSEYLEGISECIHELLDVIGKAKFSTIFIVVQEIVTTLAVLTVAMTTDATLQYVGFIYIGEGAAGLVILIVIITLNGWIDKFLSGMIGTFAVRVSGRWTEKFDHFSFVSFAFTYRFIYVFLLRTEL